MIVHTCTINKKAMRSDNTILGKGGRAVWCRAMGKGVERCGRISQVDSLGTVSYIWVCLYTVHIDLHTDHGLCAVHH